MKNVDSGYDPAVSFDSHAQHGAIATPKELTIIYYKSNEEVISRSLRLTDVSLGQNDIPLFDTHMDIDKSICAFLVNSNGRIKFTRNCFTDPSYNYQLPLLPFEKVTFVKLINTDTAVIGTSTSDIYCFSFKKGYQATIIPFYTHSLSRLPFVQHFAKSYHLPSLANSFTNHPLATGQIVDISKVDTLYFASSKKYFTIWEFNNSKPKVMI